MTQKRDQALTLVAETVGELMEFWGFRRSMGLVWTTLYLEGGTLDQEQIAQRTRLSTGSVSMTCKDLLALGVLHRELTGDRRRKYRAETDLRAIVRGVVRNRELRKIQSAIENIQQAIDLLHESREGLKAREHQRILAIVTRLEGLLSKAKMVERILRSVASTRPDIEPIRALLF